MKLTSLLLSSAAVLVAGSAFAADLPAKKAAPAAAVVACPAFGAGFFQLPGSDTCISFNGYMRAQMGFQSAADRAAAAGTAENLNAAYSNAASWRLNVDARSNTEIGVVRGYGRTSGAAVGQAYVQAAGFTAGLAGTWMGNAGGYIAPSFGSHTDSTQLSYSTALGGATLTVGVLNPGDNDRNSLNTGVAQMPDLMAKISLPLGGATLGLGVVSHETNGGTSGSETGYAVGATLGLSPAAGVSMGIEGAYSSGALGYLGTAGAASGIDSDILDVYDTNDSLVVAKANTGYVVSGYMSAAAGKGTLGLVASYTSLSNETTLVDVTGTSVELNYAISVAKGLTVTPAVAYMSGDDGVDSENTTIAILRIQRDF
jgi:hypothetical protein